MKLFHSPASPFVRKVMVLAHELGIVDRIECIRAVANPIQRDGAVVLHNPTGHVPTLVLDHGTALFDSTVICQYLDGLGGEPQLHPVSSRARTTTLCLQALADGILDAAVLVRYEDVLRPAESKWTAWADGQWSKVDSSLDLLSQAWLPHLRGPIDMGSIAVGCALGYLDFRFPEAGWRPRHVDLAAWYEDFAARPSMQATWPNANI